MQTFLPYESFRESAKCLDRPRLGKQRVECLQILRTLFGETSGWASHPAVLMWENYEGALIEYAFEIIDEWESRGYVDNCREQIAAFANQPIVYPNWLGLEVFHRSHQSNLLRKNYEWFSQYGWDVPNDYTYYWPTLMRSL